MLRYKTAMACRRFLDGAGFIDVETPMLTKSTPEGARDYLVPSRVHRPVLRPAAVAAAVQAAADGRRFRPLLPDRQVLPRRGPARRPPAEFTQVDIEPHFATRTQITGMMEEMIRTVFKEAIASNCRPFPRITYAEAMRRYGSDKPDLRVTLELTDVTDAEMSGRRGFKVFQRSRANGRVAALRISGPPLPAARSTYASSSGSTAPRAWPTSRSMTSPSSTRPACSRRSSRTCTTRPCAPSSSARAQSGDLIFFGADKAKVVNDASARCASRSVTKARHRQRPGRRCGWSIFPMFEYDEDDQALGRLPPSVHQPEGRHYRPLMKPAIRALPAKGLRPGAQRLGIGGGSVRIHRADVHAKGVRRAGIGPEEAAGQVRLPARRALKYGAPCRTAARLRPRPHRHHDDRRRVDPRRDRLPQDPARPVPAHRRGGRSSATC